MNTSAYLRKTTALSVSIILVAGILAACAASGDRRSTGETIDDGSIAARTEAALAEDSVTNANDIDIEVDRGRVQLNGFVESDVQRERAGEVARSIDGVVSVKNNLSVSAGKRTAGEYVDDSVLLTKVNAALAETSVAQALRIDVEVNRGVVSLGGHVDTDAQVDAAVAAARSVNGVRRVINNLEVR